MLLNDDWIKISFYSAAVFFYVFSVAAILFSIGAVFARQLFHAVVCLMGLFLAVGGLMFLCHAEFLAIVDLLIFAGGAVVVLMFGLVVTQHLTGEAKAYNKFLVPSLIVSVLIFITQCYVGITYALSPGGFPKSVNLPNTKMVGWALMTTYTLPFEICSIILLMVIIGAIALARKD
jgi:NADH-quinone oxidoreductase subunit J